MKFSDLPLGVILLAAGLGKRMRSPLAKVLHTVSGEPILIYVLSQVFDAIPGAKIAVVVGHQKDQVKNTVSSHARFASLVARGQIQFIEQREPRGTGDAVRAAVDSSWGVPFVQSKIPFLVLPGDIPLVSRELITKVSAMGKSKRPVVRMVTFELSDPGEYGRVVRRGGRVLKIVEAGDASPHERAICEVNAAIYLFDSQWLLRSLPLLKDRNAQGEIYLTDVIERAVRAGKRVEALRWEPAHEVMGVNDPWELAQARAHHNRTILRKLALSGVEIEDPSSCWVDSTVEVAPGARLGPGVILKGQTKIGPEAELKAGTIVTDSTIESGAKVGPYSHLRPGSHVGPSAKIGNFVELKKTSVGAKTSIAHLSYLGDAVVGAEVNIGCGFITCNFDGRVIDGERKHRTVIEDGVFVGSDCQTVAPVKLGKGAYIASGSTITEDVEPESLAIARSRQVVKSGYARRLRK